MASTAKAGVSWLVPTNTAAPVGLRVVNAVGDRHTVGIRAKIMILYQDRFAIPLGAGVFEVANLFLLLRIDADDGQALVDKSFSLLPI